VRICSIQTLIHSTADKDGSQPVVLVRGLDAPTNITLGSDGGLYVSTGQGTPGRPIPGLSGPEAIVGEVIHIRGF